MLRFSSHLQDCSGFPLFLELSGTVSPETQQTVLSFSAGRQGVHSVTATNYPGFHLASEIAELYYYYYFTTSHFNQVVKKASKELRCATVLRHGASREDWSLPVFLFIYWLQQNLGR